MTVSHILPVINARYTYQKPKIAPIWKTHDRVCDGPKVRLVMKDRYKRSPFSANFILEVRRSQMLNVGMADVNEWAKQFNVESVLTIWNGRYAELVPELDRCQYQIDW